MAAARVGGDGGRGGGRGGEGGAEDGVDGGRDGAAVGCDGRGDGRCVTADGAEVSVLTVSSLVKTTVVSGGFAVSLLISFAVTSEALDSATAGSVGM